MNIPFFKNLFTPAVDYENNPHYNIRKDSFFLDYKNHDFYLKHGWCVVKDVIRDEEIESFQNTFNEISTLDGFELDRTLLNSGRLHNPEIRKKTQNVINQNSPVIFPRIFNMDKLDTHTGGAYQVKPPHTDSSLLIHQDSTVIDETKDYCLFVWVPFCDITAENGVISFLSGSHLWGNLQRSLGVPWQFKSHIETLYKYVEPVYANKGDVIIFDPATIHSSSPNLSQKIRHAITLTVLRKNYQLVYYYRNKDIDDKLIEKYYVNENFYYDYDFIGKPNENKYKKEIVPFEDFSITNKQLIQLIKKYKPM